MRDAVRLIVLFVLVTALAACNGKPVDQPSKKGGEKVSAEDSAANQQLAAAFLDGVKTGDKAKMQKAANLTPEEIKSSLDKLVHIKQNKLTDAQRAECESVLKISGDIEFFADKLRKVLPASATIRISGTSQELTPVKHLVHTVSVTYVKAEDAIKDKTGKTVKELRLPLLQVDHPFQAKQVHEFAFSSEVFEKISNRDFEVISYF